MAKWFEIRKGADFNKIGEKYGVTPVIMDKNYICFKLDDLIEFKSKGVVSL